MYRPMLVSRQLNSGKNYNINSEKELENMENLQMCYLKTAIKVQRIIYWSVTGGEYLGVGDRE
jgi:hypothetical protein